MKRLLIVAAVLALGIQAAFAAKLTDGYVNSTTVTPGVWNYNFEAVKAYADENHVPLVMFLGSTSCGYCDGMINTGFNSTLFRNWVKEHPMCMVFQDKSSLPKDAAKIFVTEGSTSRNLPYMKIYWLKKDGSVVNVAFTGRKGTMPSKVGADRDEQLINSIEMLVGEYFTPQTPTAKFDVPNTDYNRLECEDGTKSVSVPIVRENNTAETSTDTVWANGVKIATIDWAADQTATNLVVAVNKKTLTLVIKNAEGEETSTTAITYRGDLEPSAANPLWLGEEFDFGDWTMDFDAATNKVAQSEEGAWTLVSIQGSLWCPDCANTDRNFLEVEDGEGNNLFCAWAKERNVALVSMDIPNYTSATDYATPTLYSTTAYETRLARPAEYPASGADASLTNFHARSGLGYLTRKGATSEQAAAVLAKFHALAVTNTDQGGFHRPEDGNKNRTGVPIFVLLRKDGTVAARFTRFASVSPMKADREEFANYLKRFDEMLTLLVAGDQTEIENNYPGEGAVEFAANGGTAEGSLCNADFQDAFKLVGVGGNAIQSVKITGESEAEVTAQFWKKNASGTFEAIGSLVSGELDDGINLTYTFTESGDYYLLVKGANITNDEFAAANAKADNFHAYTVTGATVLVPQGDLAAANAPAGSQQVVMRLVKDQVYRFTGVTAAANPTVFELLGTQDVYSFLKAKVSGDQEVTISTGAGGPIAYQIWQPGAIAFVETARSVAESVNDLEGDWLEFLVARTGGKSGNVKARVTLDAEKTTLADFRYTFETNAPGNAVDLTWADGNQESQIVRVQIEDDMLYDGDGNVVLKLEVLASDAGDVEVTTGRDTLTLTVLEDDKSAPGRGLITGTTPSCAKKGTVYVRESEGAKIWMKRIEASDGLVSAELTSSLAGVSYEMENPRDIETTSLGKTLVYWSSRETTEKYVKVSGIPAGKSARIQLKSFGTFKTVSASNTVTIVAVADDAPAFLETAKQFDLYRYVEVSDVEVSADMSKMTGTPAYVKIAGQIPGGLKAVWNTERNALAFRGTPTAKAGTYTATYQIVDIRDGKWVNGLTTTVTFTLTDPTDIKGNPQGANPAVAKARTLKAIPFVYEKELVGLLTLTIPTSGKMSAKLTTVAGTVAFSGSSWGSFMPDAKVLAGVLTCKVEGYGLHVAVAPDGQVVIQLTTPDYDVLEGTVDWEAWSKTNPAEDWEGYYTVACPVDVASIDEFKAFVAPRGNGYLTLKLQGSSAVNSGLVRWAGMLPNGTAVSGSAPLARQMTDEVGTWANLPIFTTSSKDVFSAFVRILANAEEKEVRRSVLAAKVEGQDCHAWWIHSEKADAGNYAVELNTYGSYYDKTEDLGGCCDEYFQTTTLNLAFDTTKLSWLYAGVPGSVTPVEVKVGSGTMAIASAENPSKVTLTLNRATGVVSGKANLSYFVGEVEKTMTVAYKGVILTGWGIGCGCGEYDVYLPFVNGSFYFTDKIEYTSGANTLKLSVKRGGAVTLDAPTPAPVD